MSDTRDTKQTTKLNDVEKEKLEKLSEGYDCSQSALIRHWINEKWEAVCGDVHPEAFDRHDMDIDEFLRGDLEPEDADDDLKMDGEAAPKVPAADGGIGSAVPPGSHTPTQTPKDLSKSGMALSWDELKDSIDQHWSDELEIHPDRVEPETLKNNQSVTSKILAAVIRSQSDGVSGALIDQTIDEYLGHQIRRADYESGLEYKINQYKPLIREHFVAHPNEDDGRQYTSPSARKDGIPHLVNLTVSDLEHNISAVDFDTWRKTNVEGADVTIADVENWVEDLADFRASLETLSTAVTEDVFREVLVDSDLETPDEYNDPLHYTSAVLKKRLKSYESADPFARYVAVKEVLGLEADEIRDEDLDSKAVIKFEGGDQTPRNGQLATVTKRVV